MAATVFEKLKSGEKLTAKERDAVERLQKALRPLQELAADILAWDKELEDRGDSET